MAALLEHRVSLVDELLTEQARAGTAVMRFSDWHDGQSHDTPVQARYYSKLIPMGKPGMGEQYAFEVNLDQCTGCKACVAACHSLNGLDDTESWRDMGALVGLEREPYLQTVTTACHHCQDPACANGCPVLAYEKDPETGIVHHLDDQCIGCSYCMLKCPYDVPKYNSKRGIVRKCDMCHQRLAVGEAPACVQSCPNEAIAIRVVNVDDIRYRNTQPQTRLLPGAFVSGYTSPTTTYVSAQPIPASARAMDEGELHLEEGHAPLSWMLVLTQMAAGLFLVSAACSHSPRAMTALNIAGFAVHLVGLIVSVLHLGQPLRAWRAFLGWRRSWLSREIMAFGGFAKVAALATAWPWLEPMAASFTPLLPSQAMLTYAAAGAGLAGVLCSAMVYVDTRRSFWSAPMVFGKFCGSMALMGASAGAAIIFGISGLSSLAAAITVIALLIHVIMVAGECYVIRRALHHPQHPWHKSALKLTRLDQRRLTSRLLAASLAWGCAVLAVSGWMGIPALWATVGALLVFYSLILERQQFFTCVTAPRMPGVPMSPHHSA